MVGEQRKRQGRNLKQNLFNEFDKGLDSMRSFKIKVTSELRKLRVENTKLNAKIDRMEKSHSAKIDRMEKSHSATVTRLEARVASLQQSVVDLTLRLQNPPPPPSLSPSSSSTTSSSSSRSTRSKNSSKSSRSTNSYNSPPPPPRSPHDSDPIINIFTVPQSNTRSIVKCKELIVNPYDINAVFVSNISIKRKDGR